MAWAGTALLDWLLLEAVKDSSALVLYSWLINGLRLLPVSPHLPPSNMSVSVRTFLPFIKDTRHIRLRFTL